MKLYLMGSMTLLKENNVATFEPEALSYLAKGLTVIPVKGRYGKSLDEAKRPLVQWQKWQGRKPDDNVVKGWFAQKPDADLGLLTGPTNGILALDIDGERGYKSLEHKELPDTWINLTRRGQHHIYKWDDRLNSVATTKVGILDGVDIRGKGGYIVAPPSVGVGDFEYKWKEGYSPSSRDLANPPEWLVQLLLESAAKEYADAPEVTVDNWLVQIKEGVAEGENRHKAMTKLASFYMSRGIPEDDVVTLMLSWNEKCKPPKDPAVFTQKLNQFLENWREGRYRSNYKDPAATKFTVQKSSEFLASGETEIDWLVQDLIPAESIGFLHGYGGQGKSWVTLDLAIEIGRGGGRWLDHFKTKPGKVLYIDEESSATLLRNRYNKLLRGKGITDSNKIDVSFMSMQELRFDNPDSLDAFRGLLAVVKPTIVIIDPFISIHGMNENSTQEMGKLRSIFKSVVKDCSTGLLFIDHESKPGEYTKTAAQRQRGSSEKDALGDYKIAISNNVKLSNPKGFQAVIEHSKARWGVSIDPFTISCRDNVDGKSSIMAYEGEAKFEDML